MFDVCFKPPASDHDINHWSFVLSHYVPETIYLLDNHRGELTQKYLGIRDGIEISLADQLPGNLPIVFLTPHQARVVPGEVSLVDFQHPDNCIYLFGPDHEVSDEDLLGSLDPDYKVYIPTDTHHEMYSHVAAAVALYDRKMKCG